MSTLFKTRLSICVMFCLLLFFKSYDPANKSSSVKLCAVWRRCLCILAPSPTLSFRGTVNDLLFFMDLSVMGSGSSSPTMSMFSFNSPEGLNHRTVTGFVFNSTNSSFPRRVPPCCFHPGHGTTGSFPVVSPTKENFVCRHTCSAFSLSGVRRVHFKFFSEYYNYINAMV